MSPPREPSPQRRRTMSFKRAAEIQETQSSRKEQLKYGSFPTYGLSWEKLKAFLERRFPNMLFEECRVNKDHYVFKIPESLTLEDIAAIQKERDAKEVIEEQRRADSEER